jgi:hypothetical protein
MYQIYLRAQASKLAARTSRRSIARARRQIAEPRQRTVHLGMALAKLANFATLCVMPGRSLDPAARPDPRDPRNW